MRKEFAIFIILIGALIVSGCTTTAPNPTPAPTPMPTPVQVVVTNITNVTNTNINSVNTSNTNITSNTNNTNINNASTSINPSYPTSVTVDISIQNYSFNPPTITISAGGTVRWTNADSVPHTVKGLKFDSGVILPGHTFEFTFTQAGVYDYVCTIHPSMQGQIIVVQ